MFRISETIVLLHVKRLNGGCSRMSRVPEFKVKTHTKIGVFDVLQLLYFFFIKRDNFNINDKIYPYQGNLEANGSLLEAV